MNIRFDGKVAVVTGAARGIGLACAEMLAESGAKVALVDILGDLLQESTKKIQEKGATAKAYPLDLTKVSEIGPTISRIRKELGEIDVLVQAAGLLPNKSALEITEEEWDACLDTNTKGLFFCMREVVGQSMIPRQTGAIVNFSSVAGLVGLGNSAHYHASKGAVIQLTREGAVEWGSYDIRVNAVAPGGTRSDKTRVIPMDPKRMEGIPLKRISESEDIAAGVCFLASDYARMITGHVLVIDGGVLAKGAG
jgi:NAD(P)-dependent dehydrogenase (short-subunit alcohol dehydrogenase family)